MSRNYRQTIYSSYVSKKTMRMGRSHTEAEYSQWAAATHHSIKGWLPTDKNVPILDMGCGAGYLIFLLKQLGYTDLTGVDSSIEQVNLARQWCPHAKIIYGDVREVLARNQKRYGLITGFDIIEHFTKDEIMPLLTLVAQALKSGGRLILQTPNAESPWMGSVAYGDFTHEWFFTPTSLSDVLRQVGIVGLEARPCGPYIHGLKSFSRTILWKFLGFLLSFISLVETGTRGSGIYTRVFVAKAEKE